MFYVNPLWLTDTIGYAEADGLNRDGTPKFKESTTIEKVRIDEQINYITAGNEIQAQVTTTVFCYTKYSELPSFVKGSLIIIDGEEFTITAVNKLRSITSNELWGYELGLI